MAEILPFRLKDNGLNNAQRVIRHLKSIIERNDEGDIVHEYAGPVLRITTTKIDLPYEEERLKCLIQGNLMTAPALSSMVCLTPGIFRDEVEAIAAFEVQMWETIPHVERFVTSERGSFTYNFRATDHDIAQILFQLIAYDKDNLPTRV